MQAIGTYAFEVTTTRPFEEAIARVTALLAQKGFGVLTEIDVQATLKRKLGQESRPYRILGACNPPFAHRALEIEPHIGVFLPCNVVVWDEGDRRVVAAIEPRVMSQVVERPELQPVADAVSTLLHEALAEIG